MSLRSSSAAQADDGDECGEPPASAVISWAVCLQILQCKILLHLLSVHEDVHEERKESSGFIFVGRNAKLNHYWNVT
jgi:hypothetical protein